MWSVNAKKKSGKRKKRIKKRKTNKGGVNKYVSCK